MNKLLFCAYLSLISFSVPPQAQAELKEVAKNIEETEFYQRKYISFYSHTEIGRLNSIFTQRLSERLKRFGYNHLSPDIHFEDLSSFLQKVMVFQQEASGETASEKERKMGAGLKFGDVAVTWSETKAIANSSFVFATTWHFAPVTLENVSLKKLYRDTKGNYPKVPFPPGTYTEEETNPLKQTYLKYWEGNIGTTLSFTVDIYRVEQGRIKKYDTLRNSWRIADLYYLSDSDVATIKSKSGLRKLDTPSSSQIEFLYSLPHFNAYRNKDPKRQYLKAAENRLDSPAMWSDIIKKIKGLDAFNIKSQLEITDSGDVRIILSEGENPEDLDLKLDDGFKVYETMTDSTGLLSQRREVGYIKIRGVSPELFAQTILSNRELESGDQIKEYPKTGGNFSYKAGLYNATFKDLSTNWVPNLGLAVDFDIAPSLGISEMFGGLNANVGYNPFDKILVLEGGLGFFKRFYFRQFIVSVGTNLAVQMAGKSDQEGKNFIDRTFGFGAVPNFGFHYQLSPDQIIGLDVGYRIFSPDVTNGLSVSAFTSNVF